MISLIVKTFQQEENDGIFMPVMRNQDPKKMSMDMLLLYIMDQWRLYEAEPSSPYSERIIVSEIVLEKRANHACGILVFSYLNVQSF